jgi:hypothetical protein
MDPLVNFYGLPLCCIALNDNDYGTSNSIFTCRQVRTMTNKTGQTPWKHDQRTGTRDVTHLFQQKVQPLSSAQARRHSTESTNCQSSNIRKSRRGLRRKEAHQHNQMPPESPNQCGQRLELQPNKVIPTHAGTILTTTEKPAIQQKKRGGYTRSHNNTHCVQLSYIALTFRHHPRQRELMQNRYRVRPCHCNQTAPRKRTRTGCWTLMRSLHAGWSAVDAELQVKT